MVQIGMAGPFNGARGPTREVWRALTGAEADGLRSRDLDLLAGFRVASETCFATADLERAEPDQLHGFAGFHAFANAR